MNRSSRRLPAAGVSICSVADSPDDLRFFIRSGGMHAGGITVHSRTDASFSYGIAVTPKMRGKGVASAALRLLFREMRARGFRLARVSVRFDNAASLALHRALGFRQAGAEGSVSFWEKDLTDGE